MTVLIREVATGLAVRDDGDGRILFGPLIPWGVEAKVLDRGRLVVETFARGALADADPARVPLTVRHPRDNQELPIGVGVELEERADAAWGAWHVSKTAAGDEVLELARDNVPLGLSIGFMEVAGVAAGHPTAAASSAPGPWSTTSPSCGPRPMSAPGSSGCERQPPEPSTPPGSWPCCAMGKARGNYSVFMGHTQGRCRACHTPFVGPGERCPKCRQKLRDRKRRKPR
jgi:hypothetical protein